MKCKAGAIVLHLRHQSRRMKATLSTRKPVDKITVADLRSFPIWEFASDKEGEPGQDETWIRPVRATMVPDGEYSLLVAASFDASPTFSLLGFMTVTTADHPADVSPGAIVTDGAYHFIPSPKMVGATEGRIALTLSLGITFPLSYKLLVLIEGEDQLREGVIQ